jgi:phosphoenolpyruvate synthase/pyruvate phosphate dikinase
MYIQWFRDADCSDGSLVGGKGANLGRLMREGIQATPDFASTWRRTGNAYPAMGSKP